MRFCCNSKWINKTGKCIWCSFQRCEKTRQYILSVQASGSDDVIRRTSEVTLDAYEWAIDRNRFTIIAKNACAKEMNRLLDDKHGYILGIADMLSVDYKIFTWFVVIDWISRWSIFANVKDNVENVWKNNACNNLTMIAKTLVICAFMLVVFFTRFYRQWHRFEFKIYA